MNAKDMRAFVNALEKLARARQIEITHSLHLSGVEAWDAPDWQLSIRTEIDAQTALAFWDAIGALEEYQPLAAQLHVTVGWKSA